MTIKYFNTTLDTININNLQSQELSKYFYKDLIYIINEYLHIPLPVQKINYDIKYSNVVKYFDTCNLLLMATQLNYSYLKQLYLNAIFKNVENELDKMIYIFEANYDLIKEDEIDIDITDITNENIDDYDEYYII